MTVNHLNPNLVELTLRDGLGNTETIRPTALHRFYNLTWGRWLSAERLRSGDELYGRSGKLVVEGLHRIPGVHTVYNMTVEREHVYYVSKLGALAHNNCDGEALAQLQKQAVDLANDMKAQRNLIDYYDTSYKYEKARIDAHEIDELEGWELLNILNGMEANLRQQWEKNNTLLDELIGKITGRPSVE
jgi:hypothetical protein